MPEVALPSARLRCQGDLDSGPAAHRIPNMTNFIKTDEAVAALTPEQFRVREILRPLERDSSLQEASYA